MHGGCGPDERMAAVRKKDVVYPARHTQTRSQSPLSYASGQRLCAIHREPSSWTRLVSTGARLCATRTQWMRGYARCQRRIRKTSRCAICGIIAIPSAFTRARRVIRALCTLFKATCDAIYLARLRAHAQTRVFICPSGALLTLFCPCRTRSRYWRARRTSLLTSRRSFRMSARCARRARPPSPSTMVWCSVPLSAAT